MMASQGALTSLRSVAGVLVVGLGRESWRTISPGKACEYVAHALSGHAHGGGCALTHVATAC